MSASYCMNCGTKLHETGHFCSACGHKLEKDVHGGNEKGEILSLSKSSKIKVVNVCSFLLFVMFGAAYYIAVFMLGFRWELVTDSLFEDYSDFPFKFYILLPIGYLLGIILISKLFTKMKVSRFVVKLTFLTSILVIFTFTLHLLYTIFLYFNSEKAIQAVIGFYPSDVGIHEYAIIEESKRTLKNKVNILIVNILAAAGFMAIVLNRYFKKQSTGFIAGLKSLKNQPGEFFWIFKQLD